MFTPLTDLLLSAKSGSSPSLSTTNAASPTSPWLPTSRPPGLTSTRSNRKLSVTKRDDYGFAASSYSSNNSSINDNNGSGRSLHSTSELSHSSYSNDDDDDVDIDDDDDKKIKKWNKLLNRLMKLNVDDLDVVTSRWRKDVDTDNESDKVSFDSPPPSPSPSPSHSLFSFSPSFSPSSSPSKSMSNSQNHKFQRHHNMLLRTLKSKLGLSSTTELLGVKLTKAVRNGIPSCLREQVWWLLCGGARKMVAEGEEGSYDVLVNRVNSVTEGNATNETAAFMKTRTEIEKDLHRTFPTNSHFASQSGVSSLRLLLTSYALRNSAIGYCQSMNFLGAFLLLNMEEERAFWTMCVIIEDILPPDYYTHNMIGSRTDQRLLLSCIKWKLPALHKHFVNIGVASNDEESVPLLEPLTCSWYLCTFINILEHNTTARVWDCFLHEGRKVLLRVGLGVMKIAEKELLACEDLCGVYEVLRSNRCIRPLTDSVTDSPNVNEVITSSELIKVAYDKSWIGGFPSGRISGMRAWHKSGVEGEVRAMSELEAEREVGRVGFERVKEERKKERELKEEEEKKEEDGRRKAVEDVGKSFDSGTRLTE